MKIIKIDAVWCMSCLIMKSRLNDVIKDLDIDILSLDYDTDDIDKYNVGDVLPVYIKYKNDKEVERLIGEHSKNELERFLEL